MNELELKEQVYEAVSVLAVSLKRQGKKMDFKELESWIRKNYQGFEHPYGARAVIISAFRRTKGNEETKNALVSSFTHNGLPVWVGD